MSTDPHLKPLAKIKAEFNWNAYIGLSKFGVEEWSFLLARRYGLVRIDPIISRHGMAYEDRFGEWAQGAKSILANPLAVPDLASRDCYSKSVEDISVYTAWCLRSDIEGQPELRDACLAEDEGHPFESVHPEGTDEWFEELLTSIRSEPSHRSLVEASYNERFIKKSDGLAIVEVQLSAPDDIVMAHFAEWLSEARAKSNYPKGPKKRFTPGELAKWSQNRVLQYLDLQTAARLAGVSPTQAQFGDLLFSDQPIDRTEKIRKTVEPLSKYLLSDEVIEALHAAANAARIQRRNGS